MNEAQQSHKMIDNIVPCTSMGQAILTTNTQPTLNAACLLATMGTPYEFPSHDHRREPASAKKKLPQTPKPL